MHVEIWAIKEDVPYPRNVQTWSFSCSNDEHSIEADCAEVEKKLKIIVLNVSFQFFN